MRIISVQAERQIIYIFLKRLISKSFPTDYACLPNCAPIYECLN